MSFFPKIAAADVGRDRTVALDPPSPPGLFLEHFSGEIP